MLTKFLKNNKILFSLLAISLIVIINNFFRFFQNNTAYQFDPWFSNYQGGFVRRGLPGEFFYQIYNFINIHPGWMIFIFVILLYIFFYFNFINLIKNIKINKLFILAILSPISFYFPVLNSKATGHKEILFLFFLSLFCLMIPKINKNQAFVIIILISIIISLSYEVLIFYLIYLIIPFFIYYNFKNFTQLTSYVTTFLVICLSLILINYHFNGSEKHTAKICDSVEQYVNQDCKNVGNIAHLSVEIKGYSSQKANWNYGETSLYPAYYIIYGLGFIVGFLPLFIIYYKIKSNIFLLNKINLKPFLILFLPLTSAIPVYYLGADWGRYLHINYMSSLILTFFLIKNDIFFYEKKIPIAKNSGFINSIFILILCIYSFGWTVPICCEKTLKPGIYKVIKRGINYYNKIN